MRNEIKTWRPIPGYEEFYEVSDDGDVRSISLLSRHGYVLNRKKPRLLKWEISRDGYARVCLCRLKSKKHFFIHRLVAFAFIPNPNDLPQINHIDENPLNNNIQNLEWCTGKQNCNHGHHRKRISERQLRNHCKSRPVAKVDSNGQIIEIYSSINDAARKMGIRGENISRCCMGKYQLVCGYKWKYLNHD